MELSILGVQRPCRVTASVKERRPLYTDQLYGTHMAIFSKSCSVAVVYRVTAIYRAVIYRLIVFFLLPTIGCS